MQDLRYGVALLISSSTVPARRFCSLFSEQVTWGLHARRQFFQQIGDVVGPFLLRERDRGQLGILKNLMEPGFANLLLAAAHQLGNPHRGFGSVRAPYPGLSVFDRTE